MWGLRRSVDWGSSWLRKLAREGRFAPQGGVFSSVTPLVSMVCVWVKAVSRHLLRRRHNWRIPGTLRTHQPQNPNHRPSRPHRRRSRQTLRPCSHRSAGSGTSSRKRNICYRNSASGIRIPGKALSSWSIRSPVRACRLRGNTYVRTRSQNPIDSWAGSVPCPHAKSSVSSSPMRWLSGVGRPGPIARGHQNRKAIWSTRLRGRIGGKDGAESGAPKARKKAKGEGGSCLGRRESNRNHCQRTGNRIT